MKVLTPEKLTVDAWNYPPAKPEDILTRLSFPFELGRARATDLLRKLPLHPSLERSPVRQTRAKLGVGSNPFQGIPARQGAGISLQFL